MRRRRCAPTRWRAGVGALLLVASAQAIEVRQFEDPGLEHRFRDLTHELRCLVCQNQTIADSNAELAKDLRGEVDRMLRAGASDAAIVQFMVDRYGEFVLYRPRVRTATLLLWFGPFVLAVAGLYLLIRQVRRHRAARAQATLTPAERDRAQALLAGVGMSAQAQASIDLGIDPGIGPGIDPGADPEADPGS